MARRNRISAAPVVLGRLVICASCFALLLTAAPGAVGAADKLVLQLHREPQFAFAGYYAALWKSFYREAGLEVDIKPGAPPGANPIDPVREVTERRAQFGTGTAQLLIRTAQGVPLLLLAPIFQQSGAAVYYRGDGDFSSPRALLNVKLGRLPSSNILDLELRTAFAGEALDPEKPKSISIEPGQTLAALADRRVDAVVGSAWELPWQARERSVALKSFTLAAYRPGFYGDCLFTLQRFANADPATAQRFRDASIKGWDYALQHPDEIAARIVAELPVRVPVADPMGFARYQSEVARKLARFSDVPLGQSNPERWSEIQENLIAIGAISRTADFKAFLYDPGTAERGFAYRLAVLILAAGTACALFATADRVWRRRHREESADSVAVRKPIAAWLDSIRLLRLVRPDLARLRAMAHDAIDRARSITGRLIAPTSASRPGPRAIDLNATLAASDRSIRQCVPKTVNWRLSLPPRLLFCHADPNAVTAIILDLAREAAAAMPNGGELVVGTRQYAVDHAKAAEFPGSAPGDYVRLTIRDSGSGLSPERLDCVFYPDRTVRPAVAAAWQLMYQLGGFAAVESAEGVGTAVHLYFRRTVESEKSGDPPAVDELEALAAE
jgi:ABC-type nitrate/sulfonate/bicarbonate transport system substrate-binding protein